MTRFSVLLPTRNGGALLDDCIRSVLEQPYEDFELVVSDNASEDDTALILTQWVDDPRVKVVKQTEPLEVSDNWNRALAASGGDYVLLIGDDDQLLPGFFAEVDGLLRRHDEPDCLTYNGYAYAFPGFAGSPHSHWADPFYEPDPRLPGAGPISREQRMDIIRDIFRFIFRLHLNMQTTVVARSAIECLRSGFFKPPFPDFYGLIALMLTAESWVYEPAQPVVVGVSPKSFGNTIHSAIDQAAGKRYLGINTDFPGQLPGSEIVNGTYRCLLALKADYRDELAGIEIDRPEYVMQQAYAWFVQARLGSLKPREVGKRLRRLRAGDWPPLARMLAARAHPAKLRARLALDRSDPAPQLWPGMRPLPEVADITQFAHWIDERRSRTAC